jgi:hypothetical protein
MGQHVPFGEEEWTSTCIAREAGTNERYVLLGRRGCQETLKTQNPSLEGVLF